MRARRGLVIGWLVVGAYALLLGTVAGLAVLDEPAPRPGPATAEARAEAFIAAWARSRTATFVTVGVYERRSTVSGASIRSEDVVAQRPPTRVHRQLGGIEGRDDDRAILCPALPAGSDAEPHCRLGAPGGPTYSESVRQEVEGLTSLLLGPDPLYRVQLGDPGCFELEQARTDPRAPFGIAATFCFDRSTGAPAGSRVRHEGGVEETVVITTIRSTVTDRDLEP